MSNPWADNQNQEVSDMVQGSNHDKQIEQEQRTVNRTNEQAIDSHFLVAYAAYFKLREDELSQALKEATKENTYGKAQ